jgi:hypothetical protein
MAQIRSIFFEFHINVINHIFIWLNLLFYKCGKNLVKSSGKNGLKLTKSLSFFWKTR